MRRLGGRRRCGDPGFGDRTGCDLGAEIEGSRAAAFETEGVGTGGEGSEDPGVQHPITDVSFAHGRVRSEPRPPIGADLDLRSRQVTARVQDQGTGVRSDVEHHAGLATGAQGPFRPLGVAVVMIGMVVVRVLVVVVLVVVACPHRQLAGTRKPLWGTPRYGNEER